MANALDYLNTDRYEDVLGGGELFQSYYVLLSSRENSYPNFHSIDICDEVVSKDIEKTDR